MVCLYAGVVLIIVKELIELLQEYNTQAEVFVDSRHVEFDIDDSSGMLDTPCINMSTI